MPNPTEASFVSVPVIVKACARRDASSVEPPMYRCNVSVCLPSESSAPIDCFVKSTSFDAANAAPMPVAVPAAVLPTCLNVFDAETSFPNSLNVIDLVATVRLLLLLGPVVGGVGKHQPHV